MRLSYKIAAVFLVLTLLTVPVAACGGAPEAPAPPPASVPTPPAPAPAPPPAPTPAPALTPEPAPAPAPAPAPTPEPPPAPEPPPPPPPVSTLLEADLLGETVTIEMGLNAAIWDAVEVNTTDGNIKANLQWGTTLMDADGQPVTEFGASLNQDPVQPEDGAVLLGPTVTLQPGATAISPELELEFKYGPFADQIAEIPDAEVYLAQLDPASGNWTKVFAEMDDENQTALLKISQLAAGHTIGLVAAPPVAEVVDPNAPSNGVNIKIEFISTVNAEEEARLIVKTEPNAWVLAWFVMPRTGTRSTRPNDRWRQADADGQIIWAFALSRHVAKGEGRMEFYASTSTDEEFLKLMQGERLVTVNPDLKDQLQAIKDGEITQLVVDDFTTIKVFPLIVAKGL